jgi:membrane protein DedA with SNARE-associated domain
MAEDYFLRYGEITVFVTRLLPVVRTFISLPAGIARMHFGRFVLYTFLGSLPWCFFLTYLGLKMGEHWTELEFWFHRFDLVLIVLAGLTLLLLAFLHKR